MSVQKYTAGFRVTALPISFSPLNVISNPNVYEGLGLLETAVSPQLKRIPGNALIDQVQLTPPFTQAWTLLQVSVAAQLFFSAKATGSWPPFAKFGKIRAGLAPSLTQSYSSVAGFPDSESMTILPPDLGSIDDLWDPTTDPLPPVDASLPLPLGMSIALPQPIMLNQGETIGAGIWMDPFLLGGPQEAHDLVGLFVCNAAYTITYDDGVTPPPAGYA